MAPWIIVQGAIFHPLFRPILGALSQASTKRRCLAFLLPKIGSIADEADCLRAKRPALQVVSLALKRLEMTWRNYNENHQNQGLLWHLSGSTRG